MLVQTWSCAGNTLQSRFKRGGGAVKHVYACLSARKDGKRRFLNCGSPVKLVQTCLCAGNTLQRHFNRRSGAVKHVQACLSDRKDGGSSFHPC